MVDDTNRDSLPKFRFGLLSTIDAPMLALTIRSALENGCKNISVICDSKLLSEKDKKLWVERTGGAFDRAESGFPTIYDFGGENVSFYFVDSHNNDQTINLIKSLGIDCLFNAGTPRRLSKKLIDSVEYGVINIHPGLLPDYRGCSCVEWAIYNDDRVGNTAHFMDEGYDTGPIIATEWYEFPKEADYQAIRVKVYENGYLMAGRVLGLIQSQKMHAADCAKQDITQGQYWEPIPDSKMANVISKLQDSGYRYQSK